MKNRRADRRGGFFSSAPTLIAAAAIGIGVPVLAGCSGDAPPAPAFELRETGLSARTHSRWPRLKRSADGAIYASWLDTSATDRAALHFSLFDGQGWTTPTLVASGDRWFINWADFPSVTGQGDHLAAHWMVRGSHGPGTYDVFIAQSSDRGRSWSAPRRPYRGGARTEQGFVTLVPDHTGFRALWLDGRDPETYPGQRGEVAPVAPQPVLPAADSGDAGGDGDEHHGHANVVMGLRYAHIGFDGSWSGERVIDPRTCDCCHTDAAESDAGLVMVYRDRDDDEIRDISRLMKTADDRWLPAMPVATDGWRIAGCPVNGPAIDARGMQVAVAWYSGEASAPGVRLARSNDGGVTFGAAQRLAIGTHVAGRADVVIDASGAAIVSWVEQGLSPAHTRWLVQRVHANGATEAVLEIMTLPPGRKSGFPQMVPAQGDTLMLAWTDWLDDVSQVRMATLTLH